MRRGAAGAAALVIELRDVGKTYRSLDGRRVRALDGVTLRVERGEVLGLAGPNGAGKSTLIALLLGYLEPTDGEVRIDGRRPRDYVERHGVGYLPELVQINPRWRADDALARYAVLAGVPGGEVRRRVDAVVAQLGLEEHRAKRIRALSKGNLQRVGLAQALLRDEALLVLDEPTHGLDPLWTQRFRDVVTALRRPDRAIFIASHNLDELQRVADRVAILDRGRVRRVVTAGRLAATTATAYRLSVAAGVELAGGAFDDVTDLGGGELLVHVSDLAALNRGLAELLRRGALVAAVAPAHSALEQQFREAVGGGAGGAA